MLGIFQIFWVMPRLLVGSMLPWYFYEQPMRILRMYGAYAGAWLEILSIKHLLMTLLSPWKSITDENDHPGFNLERWAQAITLNITTRVIGFVIRTIALAFSLAIQIILFVGFFIYLGLWFLYPVAVIGLGYMYFIGYSVGIHV
ncbi:MAG: hypothetical protein O2904_00160 [bacterium]|nr:hypothetical protein [bacterium]